MLGVALTFFATTQGKLEQEEQRKVGSKKEKGEKDRLMS
jgi:hypothetical protein